MASISVKSNRLTNRLPLVIGLDGIGRREQVQGFLDHGVCHLLNVKMDQPTWTLPRASSAPTAGHPRCRGLHCEKPACDQ